jgi:NAD(P) transhydrogenase subunit alpha
MVIGLLKEPSFETRTSLLPEHAVALKKLNVQLLMETGAGELSFATDEKYIEAGATVASRKEVMQNADVIVSINPIEDADIELCSGKVLIGFFQALFNAKSINQWAERNCTVFSMDMLPRTTRAQSMDVLSSQANIAGYKAVLLAANLYPKYFPMFMTAAGSIAPAKMLILGAGVAGLQAIATGKRLGAVIEVFDTRPAVKEEVMSLGAKFVEVEGAADASKAGGYAVEQSEDFVQRQKAKIAESVAKADIIITTAQIPGKKAPILITKSMIESMKNGAVIIDLAATTGGNTECTENDKTVVVNGVSIVGNSKLPGSMPSDASKLYGKNILNFLQLIVNKEGHLNLNFEDDLVLGTCVAHSGKISNDRVKQVLGQ